MDVIWWRPQQFGFRWAPICNAADRLDEVYVELSDLPGYERREDCVAECEVRNARLMAAVDDEIAALERQLRAARELRRRMQAAALLVSPMQDGMRLHA